MSKALKPCPFCGRRRIRSKPFADFGPVNGPPVLSLWFVECKCGAQVIEKSRDKAEAAWNRRAYAKK